MVSTEEAEDAALISFKHLADKLNLEQNVATQAWSSYQQIRTKFDLEVHINLNILLNCSLIAFVYIGRQITLAWLRSIRGLP